MPIFRGTRERDSPSEGPRFCFCATFFDIPLVDKSINYPVIVFISSSTRGTILEVSRFRIIIRSTAV